MTPESIIIRFDEVAEQSAGAVKRIVGFVRAREIITLLDSADLEANPRSAKAGAVVDDILDSISDTPESFVFKTKGILVGASSGERLQRNRYRITIENPKIEGILDGGHNTLAIGTHILVKATGNESVKRSAKDWPGFKDAWFEHRSDIEKLRKREADEETDLDFLVPLEILVPSDPSDEDCVEAFSASLLSICSARNNNVQLTLETKAGKKGFYEDLKKALPPSIAERVEWKTNDGGEVKVRDLVALAWIPLSKLDFDYVPKVPPQNTYRNKGECARLFDELLSDDRVSKPTDGEYTRSVHNRHVKAALKIAGAIPKLYDQIYLDFPDAYNQCGGKFGQINCVKMAEKMRTQPMSHFTNRKSQYNYPDGLIMPLVYGLKSLLSVDEDGLIVWGREPSKFLDDHLVQIVRKYRVILDAFRFDPQKVGKNEGSYDLVLDAYNTEILLAGK
jgi:hypothetical protein